MDTHRRNEESQFSGTLLSLCKNWKNLRKALQKLDVRSATFRKLHLTGSA
ncbi:hypothetical protein EDD27_2597 [Nonomuraea polychroma]|uniref:Uncharacterized protein n=1 Tax=Nonomuraea polychroma TaxID=46176 RepID=A0A438M318_9ACTN|nr:hypothetical protein EDD27_2597 [Nonomuraea polychroma]